MTEQSTAERIKAGLTARYTDLDLSSAFQDFVDDEEVRIRL